MCGRFTQTHSQQAILNKFIVKVTNEAIDRLNRPRYNIAPSQDVSVVLKEEDPGKGRELRFMKWGLIPSWAKVPKLKFNTINARSEGVEESPVYRNAFKRQRCLVPVSGYYEWKAGTSPKQPYYIFPEDREDMFALAGLWDCWKGKDGTTIESFTLMTTSANDFIGEVHHRMPVFLDTEGIKDWLGERSVSLERLRELMKPRKTDEVTMHPVSPAVNKVACDDPLNIQPYELLEFDF